MLTINSIFTDFIGEGLYTGQPALFIRFQGCNLDCPFCDEPQSKKDGPSISMSEEDLLAQIQLQDYRVRHVVLTGGEPLLQVTYGLLCEIQKIKHVILETNGDVDTPWLVDFMEEKYDVHLTISPKPRDFFFGGARAKVHCKYLHIADEVKLIYPVFGRPLIEEVRDSIQFILNCIDATSPHYQIVRIMPKDNEKENLIKCRQLAGMFPLISVGMQAHKVWGEY